MVSFGLMFRPGHFPLPHMLACMKVAEDVGFDHVWFGDSHLIWHEVGPYLTAAAMSTTRMRVGPLVSNPVTRHPTVVATGGGGGAAGLSLRPPGAGGVGGGRGPAGGAAEAGGGVRAGWEVAAAAPPSVPAARDRALPRGRGFPATVSNPVKALLRHY